MDFAKPTLAYKMAHTHIDELCCMYSMCGVCVRTEVRNFHVAIVGDEDVRTLDVCTPTHTHHKRER